MKKFFTYAAGVFINPLETMNKILTEKNNYMFLLAVLWDNLLLIVFIGLVTGHRLLTWLPRYILPSNEIIGNSLSFLLFCNIILFVTALLFSLLSKAINRKINVTTGFLFSYLMNSVFIAVSSVLFIIYHFLINGRDNFAAKGFFVLISVAIFIFWSFLGAMDEAKYPIINLCLFGIVTVTALFTIAGRLLFGY